MTAASDTVSAVDHCYGIVLHHRLDWWLVEFPEYETSPTRAIRLSGHLTPGLADRLRKRTRDERLPATIDVLSPQNKCWHGEFSLVRTADASDGFDIDDHHWGAEADELEMRLARTMIDGTLFPMPAGFASVFGALPEENVPVLAVRASSYTCATFELITARYMPTYRLRSPWRDISGDAVGDTGCDILGWMPAEEWIRPLQT